jgi:cysteine desulfurase
VTIYLDCNATTPLEPRVREAMLHYFDVEYGNAGSRTHEFGHRAKNAVQRARAQVATVVDADPLDVIFTSGATESNNLALLGLAPHGQETGRKHILSTAIEHKAVLEPLEVLSKRGFEITLVPPETEGWVSPEAIKAALRDDTLLVSVMHANNETGVLQPIGEIAAVLSDHPAFFHVDAAQGFGKEIAGLRSGRIDLISISGHKIYGPKGIGSLIMRSRGNKRAPLSPLFFGGGQERGLRPGTLPVPLIVGLGVAAELAVQEAIERARKNLRFKEALRSALMPLEPTWNGAWERALPNVVNLSLPGLDSEAVMLSLKGRIAISNGSACTSESYQPSHVLQAMRLSGPELRGAVRISWCHLTSDVDWKSLITPLFELV